MLKNLVYIVAATTFADLEAGRVSKVEIHKQQVRNWLLRPARHLASMEPTVAKNYEHGMALFALELMFFEPHGQYISGENSSGSASATFMIGFKRFCDWLMKREHKAQHFTEENIREIRDQSRNGLFHSGQIKDGLLVDIRRTSKEAFYKNPCWDGWLVDPWNLLSRMEEYFAEYIAILIDENHREYGKLYLPFAKTFDRLVIAPAATRASA